MRVFAKIGYPGEWMIEGGATNLSTSESLLCLSKYLCSLVYKDKLNKWSLRIYLSCIDIKKKIA